MFIAFRLLVFGLFVFLPPHIFLSRVNFPHDPVVTHGQALFFRHSQKLCRGLGRFKFIVVQVRLFAFRKDIEKYYDFFGSHAKDRPEAAGAAFAFSRDALLEMCSAKGRVGVSLPNTLRCFKQLLVGNAVLLRPPVERLDCKRRQLPFPSGLLRTGL